MEFGIVGGVCGLHAVGVFWTWSGVTSLEHQVIRRIMGVLSLAKKYGCSACDQACAAALEFRVAEYRFVRRYLERSPQAPLSLRQIDPLIRDLTQYRDFIQQRIQFEESNQ